MTAETEFPTIDLATAMNPAYFSAYRTDRRYLVLVGGAGSGKSVFAAQKWLARAMGEPGHRFAAIRKVGRTVRLSVYRLFLDVIADWGVESHWTWNRSEFSLRCHTTGSEIHCLGLDDPEKLKSIVGISGVWLEEATELTEQDFEQVDLRLRGETPGYKQIMLTFNPISRMHWLRGHFWERHQHGMTYRKRTTFRDNRFLDADYVQKIKLLAEQNPGLYRVYGEGQWGELEGLIYGPPDLGPWPESFDEVIYGLDFGFNNPTALVRCDLRDGEAYLTEELYATKLTTDDLKGHLEALKVDKNAPIYCDAAEPGRIEELYQGGWNALPADKGQGSVSAGISFCQGLALHSRAENTNLHKEFESYAWRVDKNGNPMDEPVKQHDHAMDAMRYALYTHLGRAAASVGISTL